MLEFIIVYLVIAIIVTLYVRLSDQTPPVPHFTAFESVLLGLIWPVSLIFATAYWASNKYAK